MMDIRDMRAYASLAQLEINSSHWLAQIIRGSEPENSELVNVLADICAALKRNTQSIQSWAVDSDENTEPPQIVTPETDVESILELDNSANMRSIVNSFRRLDELRNFALRNTSSNENNTRSAVDAGRE